MNILRYAAIAVIYWCHEGDHRPRTAPKRVTPGPGEKQKVLGKGGKGGIPTQNLEKEPSQQLQIKIILIQVQTARITTSPCVTSLLLREQWHYGMNSGPGVPTRYLDLFSFRDFILASRPLSRLGQCLLWIVYFDYTSGPRVPSLHVWTSLWSKWCRKRKLTSCWVASNNV